MESEKIMLDVKIKKIEKIVLSFPSCKDDVTATFLQHLDIDYRCLYKNMYAFRFSENDRLDIGQRLRCGNFENRFNGYGFRLKKERVTDFSAFLATVADRLAGNQPVIIHLDSYYCEWEENMYRNAANKHSEHLALAVGIDKKANSLIVTDAYFEQKNRSMPFDVIRKSTKFFYTPTNLCKLYQKFDVADLCRSCHSKARENALVENLEQFYAYYESHFDEKKEFGAIAHANNLFDCSLFFRKISTLVKSRQFFALFLRFCCEQTQAERYAALLSQMIVVSSNWLSLHNYYIKMKIKNSLDYSHEKACAILRHTVDSEKEFIRLLSDSAVPPKARSASETASPTFDIDIEKHLNSKGFKTENKDELFADLSGVSEYAFVKKEYRERVAAGGISYKTYFKRELTDNIECRSQEIEFPSIKVGGIALLICAQWGKKYQKIRINGGEYEADIVCEDLCFKNPETTSIGCTYTMTDSGFARLHPNVCVYSRIFTFDKPVELKSILLPDCPNLHILSLRGIAAQTENGQTARLKKGEIA